MPAATVAPSTWGGSYAHRVFDDDVVEPPVPAGLTKVSTALESLVEFLRIDADLVRVAATASPPLADSEPKPAEVRQWLATLRVAEKDDLLARLIVGNDSVLTHKLHQRVRQEGAGERGAAKVTTKRRNVAELLHEAKQAAAEKAAREKVRREREAAIVRAKYLDELASREPAIWKEVESLIATRQPRGYDQAVDLLMDLRDLAAQKSGADFQRRVEELRAAHARKETFVDRLQKAGL